MIVRVSEARVRSGREQEFVRRLEELVAGFPARLSGLLDHAILIDADDDRSVLYVTTWNDEAAPEAYAGPDWRTTPVTFPDEQELAEPAEVVSGSGLLVAEGKILL